MADRGITNLRSANPILSWLEAAAQSDLRSSQDIFNLLNSIALDNATGLALRRIGDDENVPIQGQAPSSGKVNISDSSFTKLSAKLFQGAPAPIVGSVTLNVGDVSAWPASGSLYIGRGTSNYEGPLAYSSKTNVGTNWVLNLTSPTVKFHNSTESVVLAQGGNRVVNANSVVRTPQANTADAVEFKILYSVTVADGETLVPDVLVQALQSGTVGNVAATSISQFATLPFAGATVTNPSPFSNGLDTELDDDYRERIKNARLSRAAGTPLAITTAVTGITASDENKRVISSSFLYRQGRASQLFIDDGTGYEERSQGISIETLIDSATGGEQYFQATQRPFAKASITTTNQAPFTLSSGIPLTVKVGGTTYTHNFSISDFTAIGNATAYEVVSSINANPILGFSARTAGAGTQVVLFAKEDTNDDIEVVSTEGDANDVLAFPVGRNDTLQLYKNDRLLSKDGLLAVVTSNPVAEWNTLTGAQTVIIAIDKTAPATYTFTDQDFVDQSTGFVTVGRNTVDAWAAVINAKIPGITAAVAAGAITLTSNAGRVDKAAISITGGTLVSGHMFGITAVFGNQRDYTVDRNAGQVRLETPLSTGDRLTIGSKNVRSFVESLVIPTSTLSATARLWFVVDGDATPIKHGLNTSTTLTVAVYSLHEWGHTLKITAGSGTPFTNVLAGDYIVLWDTALDASLRGAFRVSETNSSTYIVIDRRLGMALRGGHKSIALAPVSTLISKVLTIGGFTRPISNPATSTPLGVTAACEIYDPNTKLAAPASEMATARAYHTASLAGNGKVIVTGGLDRSGNALNSIEIYDPTTGTWTTSTQTLTTAVAKHHSVTLQDGRILICGGVNGTTAQNKAYTYDATSDTLTGVGNMGTARWSFGIVVLPSGLVMAAGGFTTTGVETASAEKYNDGTHSWSALTTMDNPRAEFGLALSSTTEVIAAGDTIGGGQVALHGIYNIAGNSWTSGNLHSYTFAHKSPISLHNGTVAMLHTYTASTTSGSNVYTTGSGNVVVAGNPALLETSTRYGVKYVLLSKADASYLNHVVAVGGLETLRAETAYGPCATYEEWDGNTNLWNVPDPCVNASVTLPQLGVSFVRTTGTIQEIDVPAGTNYTASSFASTLNQNLRGGVANTYRTTQLRVGTNTFAQPGGISLVTQNTDATALKLTPQTFDNTSPRVGSVESGGSEAGTPSFDDFRIRGVTASTGAAAESLVISVPSVHPGYMLVGLKSWDTIVDGTYAVSPSTISTRRSANKGARTSLLGTTSLVDTTRVDTRKQLVQPWSPGSRAYLGAPFAFGPLDDLTILVDNDPDKRFGLKMARKLATVGNVYSQSNAFVDADAANASLASTFGLSYDFKDCQVLLKARAVAYSATSRAMLFRYYRHGADGENARVRISNPVGPTTSISVAVDDTTNTTTDIRIKLAGGALRTPTVRNTSKLAANCTSVDGGGIATLVWVLNLAVNFAQRISNVTTLTTTLPGGISDHGLNISDTIYVNSTNVNFSSGLKTITGRTASTVVYAEVASDAMAANIGTVSNDSAGECTTTGSGIVANDFLQIPSSGVFSSSFTQSAFLVSAVTAGAITTKSGEATGFTPNATLQWSSIALSSNLQVFANPAQTAGQVVTAVNALSALANRKCPIDLTQLGDGTGVIDRSTPEFLDSSTTWYTLTDGVNQVASHNTPTSPSTNYTFTLKKPVTGTLTGTCDWSNEIVYLVPATAKNVVDWMNAPTVSGLFTACSIQTSSDGAKIQIASNTAGSSGSVQVQGGLANSSTAAVVGTYRTTGGGSPKAVSIVKTDDIDGVRAGKWCSIENTAAVPRNGIFTSATTLTSWAADGTVNIGGSSVFAYLTSGDQSNSKIQFERQGRYMAVSHFGWNSLSLSNVNPGDILWISPSQDTVFKQTSAANQGFFRIQRVATGDDIGGTVWIENDAGIEEVSECRMDIFIGNSMMPGDQFVINSPLWGVQNQGTWTVESVGVFGGSDPFDTDSTFKLSTTNRTPVPVSSVGALGTSASLLQVVEGTPCKFVMKIDGIVPNQTDGRFTDIRWDKNVYSSTISSAAGSIVSVLDKLDFPLDVVSGADGYRYCTGLIGEANKVVYGDPSDTTTYPGVAAAGAQINITGPLVKKISLALSLRIRSGVSNSDVANRVRSAVATVVNQTPQGSSIALSAIVAAAEKVVGVVAAAMVSPVYTSTSDLITVQGSEKPMVLNLSDIQISFVGE